MILLLDSSTPYATLTLVDGDFYYEDTWHADRELARRLLGYLRDQLSKHDKTFHDISGIVGFRGPGSFTGLRIGLTVLNTLAESLQVPIVGEAGEYWQKKGQTRLHSGENDTIILPEYGSAATITKPRK